jgi:hypothetical protein
MASDVVRAHVPPSRRARTGPHSGPRAPLGGVRYVAELAHGGIYEGLSAELDFNLLFSQRGHLTLAHSDRAMFVMAGSSDRLVSELTVAAVSH